MSRPLALAALLVVLATGCATRGAYHRLQADVTAARGELTDLRQVQEKTTRELARAQADTRALETRTAEVSAALKESSAEVGRLRTRLEAVEAEAREARTLAATPPAPPPAPAPAPAAPAPVLEKPRDTPIPRAVSPEAAYNAALATFRLGEHGQAVLDFLDFIAKHRKHPLVANAQYWIGEAYYVQRDFRQALVEFQKVLEVAPGSHKVPDALLKIGLSYRGLRDDKQARTAWQRVVREFPKSESAVKARALLQ